MTETQVLTSAGVLFVSILGVAWKILYGFRESVEREIAKRLESNLDIFKEMRLDVRSINGALLGTIDNPMGILPRILHQEEAMRQIKSKLDTLCKNCKYYGGEDYQK